MRFHSLRTAVLFGLVAFAPMANGKKPIAAAQLAPLPAPPSVALSASPASAQAGQPVTLTWSSTNATSITLKPSVGGIAAQGSMTVRPSQSSTYTVTATGPGGSAHARAPSGGGPEAFSGRDPVRPTADEGPRRTDPGDQVRRPPDVGGAEPAGGETAVPVGDTGRDLRRAGQGRHDAPRRRAAPDRRPTRCALHLQRQRARGPAQGRRATDLRRQRGDWGSPAGGACRRQA